MSVSQTDFVAALLDSEIPASEGLCAPQNAPAGKRFDVYRNNVAVSLTDALIQSFPVIEKIVGPEFFAAMAGVFPRQHPLQNPLMMHYGTEMHAFLSEFPPVAELPYLPDVARLEIALRASYHAADAPPIAAELLQSIPPEALMAAKFALAPAVHVLRAPWPLHAIYVANTQPNAPAVSPGAQDVLLVRAEFDPEVVLLPAGGADFIQTLSAGKTFAQAIDAGAKSDGFDLSKNLGLLLSGGAITEIHQPQGSS